MPIAPVSCAVLAILTIISAVIVRLMIRRGVLDIPGARSSHDRPTPKGGGLGIAAAFAVGLPIAWVAGLIPGEGRETVALLVAGLLIAAVAWADDIGQFGFRTKLAAQIVSAILVTAGGLTIDRLGPLDLGAAGIPLTIAWLLVAMNATNFIDGLNGLAAGCTLIGALAVAVIALHAGDPFPAASLLPLAAGIVGFLPFNFPNARIFMGDVGSQLCGLVLAASAGPASALAGHPWGALLVPLAMAPILADVAFTLVRRFLAGDRLTEAHRGHLYQLANRAGSPAWQITLAFWALTAESAIIGSYCTEGPIIVGIVAVAIPLAVAAVLVIRFARKADLQKW